MIREPAVAGKFYPENEDVLTNQVAELFSKAKTKIVNNTVAVISPHAGYIFSGLVAASAFNQLENSRQYRTVFLIGTSHHTYLSGASIYYKGDCKIPGATIKVNKEIARQLISKYQVFDFQQEAHIYEHTLEVQLPFLAYKLNYDFSIVPIIIGTNNIKQIQVIAKALQPYFGRKDVLFVISTDLSHYPKYDDAIKVDNITIEAILKNSPQDFINAFERMKDFHIPNLATPICGYSSVLTLLYITSESEDINYHKIDYKNSGDSPYGDKYQVVGYVAIAITKNK